MTPLRPLLVIESLNPRSGGPPRVAVGLAIALKEAGHEPVLAVIASEQDRRESADAWPELEQAGVEVRWFAESWPSRGASRDLVDFGCSAEFQFDVVHFQGPWSFAFPPLARRAHKMNIPYIVAAHGTLDPWALKSSRMKKIIALRFLGFRRFLSRADRIQYGTENEAMLCEPLGFAPGRVVGNGITIPKFVPGARAALAGKEHELGGDGPLVLFLARFNVKKGPLLLLEAFARTATFHPSARLLLAGIPEDPDLERQLRARAARADLRDRVVVTTEYLGATAAPLLSAADIVAIPSLSEGLSIALLEGLAAAKAVLVSNQCHVNSVGETDSAIVVAPEVESIAQGLERLFSMSSAERVQLGERGRQWVLDRYSWPAIAEQTAQLYREAIDGRSS